MTTTGRRAVLLRALRDPMWQMGGVLVTILIAVVTAVAASGGDDRPPLVPAVTTSVAPAPGAVQVSGACNAVGTGNTVNC